MGGEQAAGVLATIQRDRKEANQRPGQSAWSAQEEEEFRRPIREEYDGQSTSLFSSARLWDDGIVEPADTRKVLALALMAATRSARGGGGQTAASGGREARFGVFRM